MDSLECGIGIGFLGAHAVSRGVDYIPPPADRRRTGGPRPARALPWPPGDLAPGKDMAARGGRGIWACCWGEEGVVRGRKWIVKGRGWEGMDTA